MFIIPNMKLLYLQCFITVSICVYLANSQDAPRCYVKETVSNKTKDNQTCSLLYFHNPEKCFSKKFSNLSLILNSKIEQTVDRPGTNALVNISVPLEESGSVVLVISGTITSNEMRCITLNFSYVEIDSLKEKVSLNIDNLELPYGNYSLIGFLIVDFRVHKNLTNQHFQVPSSQISRERRDKHSHLLQQENCTCNGCAEFSYISDGALIQFFMNMTTPSCCSNFSVQLLKYIGKDEKLDQQQCENGLMKVPDFNQLTTVGSKRNFDTIPINFPNTQFGCYVIKTHDMACKNSLYHGYFWISKSSSWIDLNKWNVSIVLTPRNSEGSIEIGWECLLPYNFKSWKLNLWYLKNKEVNCVENTSNQQIIIFSTNEPTITGNIYTFTNLSQGYYCARLTPIDIRCPKDGCYPRASYYIRLGRPNGPTVKKQATFTTAIVSILAAVAIVGGISLAFLCYRYQKVQPKEQILYSSVTQNCYQMETIPVLLIWTRFTTQDVEIEPVINAFKDILASYSKCKIYDYLDSSSMDKKQRQLLLSDPTEWLKIHLKNSNEKIIFVGSDGSRIRQLEKGDSIEGKYMKEDCMDRLLFPNVIRYLHESKDLLTSDYAKIFYVKVPGLSGLESDSEGLVPRIRYTIPAHLRSLTLKLHGLTEDIDFPEPQEEWIEKLNNAIMLAQIPINSSSISTFIPPSDSWKPD